MEIEEITKIVIFVLVLIVVVAAVSYFLGGSDLFGNLKNLLRFGR